MAINPATVLRHIIESNGKCSDWCTHSHCRACPLGTKLDEDGQELNCLEYVKPDYDPLKPLEDVDALFKRAAEEELFAMQLEKLLE